MPLLHIRMSSSKLTSWKKQPLFTSNYFSNFSHTVFTQMKTEWPQKFYAFLTSRRRTFRIDSQVHYAGAHPRLQYFELARIVRPNSASIWPTSAGWPAQLAANVFNRLDQYMPAVVVTGLTATRHSLFLPGGGWNYHQYSLCLIMEGWPGWVNYTRYNYYFIV